MTKNRNFCVMASKHNKPQKLFSSRSGGYRSLADMNRMSGPDSDSDSDGPQERRTGGEKSDMLVQDHSKVNDVDDILDQARQLEDIEGCPRDSLLPSPSSTPRRPSITVAFQGAGRTLGGNLTRASSEPITALLPHSDGLVVDETKPKTSIQLRLADGTRMIAHFNYHHTVSDIRGFIDSLRSGGSRTYQLQAVGFPPKPLIDLKATIVQAGLANSVVVQKL